MTATVVRPKIEVPKKKEKPIPVSIFATHAKKEFTCYDVSLEILEDIQGGIPSDPHMIRGWLQRNAGVSHEALNRKMLIDTMEHLGYDTSGLGEAGTMDALEEAAAQMVGLSKTVRFKQDEGGLYIENRQIESGLKEAANIAFPPEAGWFSKTTGRKSETKNPNAAKGLKSLFAEWVFVEPRRIYLGVSQPDLVDTKVSHTPRGASIGQVEQVNNPTISFELHSFRDLVQQDVWATVWTALEKLGLGANRSQGHGRFVTLQFERRS